MRNEAFRRVALRIYKDNMASGKSISDRGITSSKGVDELVDVADALQLVRVAMVVRAAIYTDEEDRDVGPREAEKVELKFVH